ncbi:MAG TPA: PIG-L family deacetylase [Ktedonobacterales bacterium]|nr:PIG-L family deacetylase [Ktedonobacterales bacterium]
MATLNAVNAHHTMGARPMRALGVFAHPDDEVFCAGGTLAQWAEAGVETMIVSATRGEAGQIQDTHRATRHTLGTVREQELRMACAELGVGRVECLDYCDGGLAEVDSEGLADDVAARIRDFQPDLVVTFGPDGGSGHPDHIAISRATTLACQLVAREEGWAPQLYYSIFPRQHGLICQSLARWLMMRGEAFRGSAEFVRALALVADEVALMGYADDDVQAQWFPSDFAIVEQGERGSGLYLIVSGHAQVIAEDAQGIRRTLQTLGPGQFFGAEALTSRGGHEASLVAIDTVTCLVLSTQTSTAFDARGEGARQGDATHNTCDEEQRLGLIRLDIAPSLGRKVAALVAHRTQFAVAPGMSALAPVWRLMSREYFERVSLDAALDLDMRPPLAMPA